MEDFRATRGFCIGQVGPEASVGGPIALLRNGDIIDLDAKELLTFAYQKKNQLKEEKMETKENKFWQWYTLEI